MEGLLVVALVSILHPTLLKSQFAKEEEAAGKKISALINKALRGVRANVMEQLPLE